MLKAPIERVFLWSVPLISFIVFILTCAPSLSFWDSGEWIVASHTLSIPHPPGAPFYQLLARITILLSPFSPAFTLNLFSCFFAAVTSQFIYRLALILISAVHLKNNTSIWGATLPAICAACAAWMFAFSDTHWRNAVESEVYALNTCMVFLVLWLCVKAVQQTSIKLLFLIALLEGLGLAVHPTQFMTIPFFILAMGLVCIPKNIQRYYFWLLSSTLLISVAAYLWWNWGWLAYQEFFILQLSCNAGMGMGINPTWAWGIAIAMLFIIIGLSTFFVKNNTLKIIGWSILIFHLGVSVYALIPIRANAGPPLNMGNPNEIIRFKNYILRTEFNPPSLLKGKWFTETSQESETSDLMEWQGTCYQTKPKSNDNIPEESQHWFPRMYNSQYADAYRSWIDKPKELSFGYWDQLRFAIIYQFGFQYFRYLGWNLIGKETDEPFADVASGWFQDSVPEKILYKPGAVYYWGIPLIFVSLGILVLFFLPPPLTLLWLLGWFITGPLLVFILNMTPDQIRERDYIYQNNLGLVFLLIALGLYYLLSHLPEKLLKVAPIVLILPALYLLWGWNSHNKSNAFFVKQYAEQLLNDALPGAILFSAGDNDTFPLWCLQHTEGIRKDVTVINLNLLQRLWYLSSLQKGHLSKDTLFNNFAKEFHFAFDEPNYLPKIIPVSADPFPAEWKQTPQNWLRYKTLAAKIILKATDDSSHQRPIYFTQTVPSYMRIYLQESLKPEGLLLRYAPASLKSNPISATYRTLFHFQSWNTIPFEELNFEERKARARIRNNCILMADECLDHNKPLLAQSVLMLLETKLHKEKWKLSTKNAIILGGAFYRTGLKSKAFEAWSQVWARSLLIIPYYQSKGKINEAKAERMQLIQLISAIRAIGFPLSAEKMARQVPILYQEE